MRILDGVLSLLLVSRVSSPGANSYFGLLATPEHTRAGEKGKADAATGK